MPQGWDFGALGGSKTLRLKHGIGADLSFFILYPRGVKSFLFKHGHVAYQIKGDEEQNKMQVKFSSYGQTGDLGVRSKGQISLNFGYHVNFNFLCVLTKRR